MTVQIPTTFNPSDKGAGAGLSNGNRTVTNTAAAMARTYTKVSSGKWYFEISRTTTTFMFGLANSSASLTQYPGQSTSSIGLYSGSLYINGSVVETVGALGATGVFGVAVDADARTIRVFNAVGTSTSRAIGFTGDIYIAVGTDGGVGGGGSCTLNAGQDAFTYSVPSGHTSGFALRSVYAVSGNVKNASNANAARTLQALVRSTGALAATTTSDGSTGNYTLIPEPNSTAELIVLALPVSTSENVLVLDRMVPG